MVASESKPSIMVQDKDGRWELSDDLTPAPKGRSVLMVLGLPGSGKSTAARSLLQAPAQMVNFDSIRLALGTVYNQGLEPLVEAVALVAIESALISGYDVVVDESVDEFPLAFRIARIAARQDAQLDMLIVDTPVGICQDRRVGEGVMPEKDFGCKYLNWVNSRSSITSLATGTVMYHIGCDLP